MENKNIKYIFWGSGPLAESALFNLYKNDLIPSLVITSPDKKSGRNMEIKKNIIALWCESKNIKYWQPETLKNINIESSPLVETDFDIAIVASYPKILKEEILNIPKYETLNIHPSLLPKYRGPSPLQSALLNGDEKIGITIIKLDKEVDHGPILIKKEINVLEEDNNETIERKCGAIGAEMLTEILPHYIEGNLKTIEQNHDEATFTHKFEKTDGEIKLEDNAIQIQNKFKALLPHIPIYFFTNHPTSHKASQDKQYKEIRVKVSEINLSKDFAKDKIAKDIIEKVIPEGKSEMNFEDFKRGYIV